MTNKEEPARLEDGSEPARPRDLLDRLAALGIESTTVRHAPVFTVEEAKAERGDLPGSHTKSLFLRNKKGRMWLVVCLEDRVVDLKSLAREIGAGRLSFGSSERLMRYLGVVPGAVSPFSVINDHGRKVQTVLDRGLLESDRVNLHPLDNAMTTAVAPEGLLRFLEEEDHPPLLIDLSRLGRGGTVPG